MSTPFEFTQGLDLKAPDKRDFPLFGVMAAPELSDLPVGDYLIGSAFIKNQHATDMCTGFGLAAVLEDEEEVELSPEWLFAQIKKMRGDPMAYGGDLNTGCKVATKLGAIEKVDAPFDVDSKDRNFLAVAANWPAGLTQNASKHLSQSFFNIKGPYDTFDNIRAALWANKDSKRSVYTGCVWRPGWLYASGGVLPPQKIAGGTGHCFKIAIGQKIINSEPHLMIQNSGGTGVGDNGYFYMSRAVANRELVYGAYMRIDMPPDQAKDILRPQGLLVEDGSWWEWFVNLCKQLIHS